MKIQNFLGTLLCSVLVFSGLPVLKMSAFQLNPISQEFSPSGKQSTQSYRITNPRSEPIAIDIAVFQRLISNSGQETLQPADEDFIVYPPQLILPPLATQVVRVTWVGDAEPDAELSYRFVAEQLPVSLEKTGDAPKATSRATGAVRMMMRYAGSLYVRPADSFSQLVLQESRREQGADGEDLLFLRIKNEGGRHGKISRVNLQLNAGGQSVVLPGKELLGKATPVVLAGGERHLLVPWPAELPIDTVTGTIILQD